MNTLSWFFRQFVVKTTFAKIAIMTLLIGGSLAYSSLIKETTPDLEIGVGIIFTEWAEGDAQSIELEVTNPLEKELKSLKGLKKLQSGTYAGLSIVAAEFYADVDQQDAMTRLRSKVAAAEGELPKGAKKPVVVEASVNDSPIFSFRLHGEVSDRQLALLSKELKRALERVPGVNKVNVAGENLPVVRVRLIAARLAALGLSSQTIANVIEASNVDMPLDQFDGEAVGVNFRLEGKFREINDLKEMPVATLSSGHTVYLKDVAEVTMGPDVNYGSTYFSVGGAAFESAIDITLTKRPGADAIKTIGLVKKQLESFQQQAVWPDSLNLTLVVDESEFIITDLKSVFNNAWQAMLAVFVILFISLSWREAVVACLAIPLTLAFAVIIVFAVGYTLNQIVIIGMVLALGLLVDDFILMMEGLHEHLFMKNESFIDAAVGTIRTFAVPSLSGSLTTILAMAPLMMIAGIEGKFIRQMPVTAIACLSASYLVSVFLAVPMAKYLLANKTLKKSAMDKFTEKASVRLTSILSGRFVFSRKRSALWLTATVIFWFSSYAVFTEVPTELSPKGDGRSMGMTIELSPDSSLATAKQCGLAIGNTLNQHPDIETLTLHVGEKSPFSLVSTTDQLSPTTGHHLIGVSLRFIEKDLRERKVFEYVPQIKRQLTPVLSQCPGGVVYFSPELGGASAADPIQLTITGKNMGMLKDMADEVKRVLTKVQGTQDIRDNFGIPKTALVATPNREALAFYNMSADNLASQLRRLMAFDKVGEFVQPDGEEDLDIKMGFAWPSRKGDVGGPQTLAELSFLTVINDEGQEIALGSLVEFRLQQESLSYLHLDGLRTLTVMAKTDNRTAEEILADAMPTLRELSENWPAGYELGIAGEAEASDEVFGSAGKMLVLALFLVFALLALQFDSFKQPLIIMSAIPLALTGVYWGFVVAGIPFSFMAMVGIIALIGIVVNDTIIMIETMNRHRDNGLSLTEAAARGASDRLRPIVTTSVTTIAGLIPLAFSQEMWLPLSLTVISGLIFATFLALFIVPCIYRLFTTEKRVA